MCKSSKRKLLVFITLFVLIVYQVSQKTIINNQGVIASEENIRYDSLESKQINSILRHKIMDNLFFVDELKQGAERFIQSIKKHVNTSENIKPEKLIAHAGGRIKDFTYTNCKEALDKSYNNGFKFIEVDFEWTTDNQSVLLHSWDWFIPRFFGVEEERYSLKEFKEFDMINDWHQMTLEDLVEWVKEHPDVYIVTDVKRENIKLLALIKYKYTSIQKQIIPQIYSRNEYNKAKNLGYDNIIFTLYRTSDTVKEIIDFAKENDLLAVTMPIERAKTSLPKELKDIGVFTYSHTINDVNVVKELEEKGIDGFYTDDLIPE